MGKTISVLISQQICKIQRERNPKKTKKNFVIVYTVHATVQLLRATGLDFEKLLKLGVSAETEDARIKFC